MVCAIPSGETEMEASLRDVGYGAINSHLITWFLCLLTESPHLMCLR